MAEENPQNPEEAKDSTPSAPQQPDGHGNILPDTDGVPEDDSAEPEDAGVDHTASEDEVNEAQGES